MKSVIVTPRSLTQSGHPLLERIKQAGYEVVFPSPGAQPTGQQLAASLKEAVGYLAGVEKISAEVLDGAKNDEATRGFYNEFLHPRLEPHRKVFEVIGDKTKCQPTKGQLSGLGFSSTKKTSFVVRAQCDKQRRLFNIQVGV